MHEKTIKGEEKKTELMQIAISGAVVLLTLLSTLLKIKNEKNTIKKQNAVINLSKVFQKLPEYINEAETLIGRGGGDKKLLLVLDKIKMDCLKLNVNYEEKLTDFQAEIEKIMETPQKRENRKPETTNYALMTQNQLLIKEIEELKNEKKNS